MKKLFILITSLLIASVWYFNISNKNKILAERENNIKIADNYFLNGLYIDAINHYEKAETIESNQNIKSKIVESYLKIRNFDAAFQYLQSISDSGEFKTNLTLNFFDKLLASDYYSKYNNYLKKVDDNIAEIVSKRNWAKYRALDAVFDDVRYSIDNSVIFVKKENKWVMINEKGKMISPKYEEILSFDSEMMTVKDEGKYKIIDMANNIRSNIKSKNIFGYRSGLLVENFEDGQAYIDRTNKLQSEKYNRASNYNVNLALIFDEENKVIDKGLNIVRKIEGNGFKTDQNNDAIFDKKIIIKTSNKYKIYNLDSGKYSQAYDDIDFSYGEYIAVKQNEKWGYIDQDFNEIISPKFSYANSFHLGIAIVKQGENYIIIDKDGNELIKTLKKILPFNNDGIGFIREEDTWRTIKLVRYIDD